MPLFYTIGSLFQHAPRRDLLLEATSTSVISSDAAVSRAIGVDFGHAAHQPVHRVISHKASPHRGASPAPHPSRSPPRFMKRSPHRQSPASQQHHPKFLHAAANRLHELVHRPSHATPPQHHAAAAAPGVRIGPDGGINYDGGATANNHAGAPTGQVAKDPNLTQERAFLLSDLNADRAKHGLPPLQENTTLNNEAEHRSTDMIQRNYFNHLIPDSGAGHYFMQELPSMPQHYGENVAENSYIKQGMSKQQVMNQTEEDFMNSPGHRTNVLDSNFDQVGLGVAYTPQGQLKLTEDFTN